WRPISEYSVAHTSIEGASSSSEVGLDAGLMCLVYLARFLRIAADKDQIKHGSGRGEEAFTAGDILRAAKRLRLKARKISANFKDVSRLFLPAIAQMKDGNFVILAAHSSDRVLIQDPRAQGPEELTKHAFQERWDGKLILITAREMDVSLARRFDFTWFIPELVRYRHILSEILLVTLLLQLVSLITPIFFQLVIDKVLVHQGLATLYVLVIGLAAVLMFESFLSTLRTYVSAHTAAKVDVT